MKILSAALLGVALCGMLLPSPAMATGCTATLTCNDACSVRVSCPPAGSDCFRACSAPASTLTCNGSTSCSVGTSSVTCDGVAHSCSTANRCIKGTNFVQCSNTPSVCPARCPV